MAALTGNDFGETSLLSRVVYGAIGIAAVYGVIRLAGLARRPGVGRGSGMSSLSRLAVALATLALASVSVAGASARPSAGEQNIVRTAQQAGSFKTLLAFATKAGLADDLASGRLTLLAPTDAAFKKVPKATLRAVQKDVRLLRRVLLYHVIAGKVPSTKVVTLRSAKTLAGPTVKIRVAGRRVFVNNARVTKVDVAASNGVIHVIDRVLIPSKR